MQVASALGALTFIEGFAIAAGLTQLFVATVFFRFRHHQPDWGLGWWAATYLLAGLMNVAAPLSLPVMKSNAVMWPQLVSMCMGFSAVACLVAGGRAYTGNRRPGVWAAFAITWLVYICCVALAAFYPSTRAIGANLATAVIFMYMGYLSLGAMSREPGAGHGIAAATLCLYVPLIGLAYFWGLDWVDTRYWSSLPFTLAGLGVMSATMGRMRCNLKELNESLEQRVVSRTQELRNIVDSLESFNRMVSHDLRGPLGGMAGLSEIALTALKAGDTRRAEQLFTVVQTQAGSLSGLVADLLTLARISDAPVRREQIDLAELVAEAQQALQLSHGPAHTTALVVGPLPVIEGDRSLLRQVMINLLGNAIKFSREVEHPEVRVSAEQNAHGWRIAVHDNGVGFDGKRSAELFEPFKRLHGHLSYEGSGLGLPLVQRIILRHHGEVGADSDGRGATFWFQLPASPPSHSH